MAGTIELGIWVSGSEITYDPWGTSPKHKITCTTFDLCGTNGVHAKTGQPHGTRDYGDGIIVTKRLDTTSPRLLEIFRGATGLKAEFVFYAPDLSPGADPMQVALTVTIGEGCDRAWLRSYRLIAPDADHPVPGAPVEAYEELKFSFTHIKFHRSGTDHKLNPVSLVTEDDLSALPA